MSSLLKTILNRIFNRNKNENKPDEAMADTKPQQELSQQKLSQQEPQQQQKPQQSAAKQLFKAASLSAGAAAIALITTYEGLRLEAYKDPVGVWTICYGSTKNVQPGQVATLQECENRLGADAEEAANAVRKYVQHPITQEQFDALVDFTFNLGAGNFKNSTLLRKLNAGDCYGAAEEFRRWVYAGGQVLPGLQKRREAEYELFLADCQYWPEYSKEIANAN
jgi:lysozyme